MVDSSAPQRHFIISDRCAPEQRKVFEAINRCLDKFDLSADEFDRYFRLSLMNQCLMAGESAHIGMLVKLKPHFMTQVMMKSPDLTSGAKRYAHLLAALDEKGLIDVKTLRPYKNADHFLALYRDAQKQEPLFVSEIVNTINERFGRFQDISRPTSTDELETYVLDRFHAMARNKAIPRKAKHQNFLQEFADGKPLMDKAGTFANWKSDFNSFETGSVSVYFSNALFIAIQTAGRRKGFENERYLREVGHEIPVIVNALEAIEAAAPRHMNNETSPAAAVKPQSAEALHALEEERTREREKALLKHLPYALPSRLQSIATRATRTNPAPEKELVEAWAQLEPMTKSLNANFQPHQELGDLLFKERDGNTLRILDHICTGAPLPEMDAALRTKTRDAILSAISDPIEKIAPELTTPGLRDKLIENNREGHKRLGKQLPQAQLLMIAALGTPELIADARAAYALLYPERKRDIPDAQTQAMLQEELQQTASKALRQAFADAGKDVPVHLAPPPPAADRNAAEWESLRKRAETFVSERLQDNPPFNMFRCNLDMQPGHAVTLHLSRWVNGNGHRRVETCSDTLLLREPSLERALDTKKRLQSHILNTQKVIEHRRLHEGHYVATDDDFLPNAAPMIDPNRAEADGLAGRIFKRGGVFTLKLIFPDKESRTEVAIPLGVQQDGDFDEANRRRLMILDHLEQMREGSRHLTGQDVRVWLQNVVMQKGKAWEQAQSIDLRDHPSVQNDIAVKIAGPEGEKTTLHVENPRLEGTPNAYWSVPVSIRLDGKEIAKTSVNTHIRDADTVLRRIDEVTSHLKTGLERHAVEHPKAHWQLGENHRLMQFNEEHLGKTQNMDWTRLDRIKDELGYVHQLSVRASEVGDGGAFTLGVQRADGTQFLQDTPGLRHGSPLQREVTIGASLPAGEETALAEKFREAVHTGFISAVQEAYRPQRDPAFEKSGQHQRKALQRYDSRSVVSMFDAACRTAEQQAFAKEAGITVAAGRFAPSKESGAGKPMQR